jgi:hypothetical protein
MSSPFPDMAPYFEGEMWQRFHETLTGANRAQLMPCLTPKYVALPAKGYALDRVPYSASLVFPLRASSP